jgi:protein SCO1/2
MASFVALVLSAFLASADSSLASDSLYQLQSSWQTQTGESVKLESLKGKPVVMAMAYTSCTYSCPLTVAKMKEIESSIKAAGISDYQMAIASFDTKGDRPVQTAAYMKKKGLNPSRWTWLSASDDKSVRELAAVLGVTYSRMGKSDFSHSNQIVVLDRDGRLSAQINGLNADHSPLVKVLTGGMKAN